MEWAVSADVEFPCLGGYAFKVLSLFVVSFVCFVDVYSAFVDGFVFVGWRFAGWVVFGVSGFYGVVACDWEVWLWLGVV